MIVLLSLVFGVMRRLLRKEVIHLYTSCNYYSLSGEPTKDPVDIARRKKMDCGMQYDYNMTTT